MDFKSKSIFISCFIRPFKDSIIGLSFSEIDGFYMNSSFDLYHDLALLSPKVPDKVSNEIQEKVIIDANDFGVKILGKCKCLERNSDEFLKTLVKDSPAGQDDKLTPLILFKNVLM